MKEKTFEIYANGQFLAVVTEQLLRPTINMITSMINYQADTVIRVVEVDYTCSLAREVTKEESKDGE